MGEGGNSVSHPFAAIDAIIARSVDRSLANRIPCLAGQGYMHSDAVTASQCRICHPEIRQREQLSADRLRDLKAAANAYHFAKHKGKGVAAAQKRLLNAAWSYGDAPNVLTPREQGNKALSEP